MLKFILVGVTFLVAVSGVAEASWATVKPVPHRNVPSSGMTTFTLELCVCLNGNDLFNWVANGGQVQLDIPATTEVTENDPIDDDELGACGGSFGPIHVTVPFTTQQDWCCPDDPPICATVPGYSCVVPSSAYGSENPGDFQLGTLGSQEGTVPSGSTVSIPGYNGPPTSMTPSFPNNSA